MDHSQGIDVRVISIGALAANHLWNERSVARTGHATTTLVRASGKSILIDPGLPEPALVARLSERANLTPDKVTDVFLTSFHPECRRALPAFDKARWFVAERERESVGVPLAQSLGRLIESRDAAEAGGEEFHDDQATMLKVLQQDIAILQRCKAAPDSLAEGVDLFPLPGVSAGLCGVLIAEPTRTTLVCGDAVPTAEHLEQGKVLPNAQDVEQAQESFREAVEIADVLVLGRDNWQLNRTRRAF